MQLLYSYSRILVVACVLNWLLHPYELLSDSHKLQKIEQGRAHAVRDGPGAITRPNVYNFKCAEERISLSNSTFFAEFDYYVNN